MGLRKIKNPVEYSFTIWMNNHPDSRHWADKKRFFAFVKTVCRYKAKRWKRADYLRNRILKYQVNFDREYLDKLLDLYLELLNYSEAHPLTGDFQFSDVNVTEGYYMELVARNGTISRKEVKL